MYRQVFTPTEQDIKISIPPEWQGQLVEVIAFPISNSTALPQQDAAATKAQRRKEIDDLFDKYPIDLSNFKFDRDEANDYD
jgi:hypothetical protein